jgi:hypothetical protein
MQELLNFLHVIESKVSQITYTHGQKITRLHIYSPRLFSSHLGGPLRLCVFGAAKTHTLI